MIRNFIPGSLIAWVGMMTGCDSDKGESMRFIAPNGFRGTLYLILDSKNGIDLKPVNGEYVIRFPASGKVYIKDDKMSDKWHEESCEYEDGTRIPLGVEANPDTIAFYGVGFRSNHVTNVKSLVFVIGTRDDRNKEL